MVNNKLILTTVYGRRVLIHLIDDQIERIRVINDSSQYPIGTVVLARVKKMIPSSNACFVNIGNGIDYFLQIDKNLNNIVFTDGKEHKTIHCEDQILVQIQSEAVKLKQPTVSTNISITGRYFVIEQGSGLSYSKKITKAEKKNIQLPSTTCNITSKYRVVVRTEASLLATNSLESSSDIFDAEVNDLYSNMNRIFDKANCLNDFSILYKPENDLLVTIREWIKFGVLELITDEEQFVPALSDLASNELNVSFNFYSDDDYPLYKLYKLETLIDGLLIKKVYLKSGGFLVVEQGETLTAIDVNTGHAIKGDKQEAIFKVNMEASYAIASLLKNRNISGMILVDFINMKDFSNEKQLIEHMKLLLSKDDVKTSYVDMTGLGLMEITRQRKYKTFAEQWKNT